MTNKIKVAAYCRVSTDMEDQLHSLSAQIKYFTEYISGYEGYELIEVYYDEGITGTSTKKRDGFNRMIADCESGKINTILTKEVSRFARNTVDTLNYTRKLSQLNINVIFMNDGIDTNDKDGELRLTIMSSIAQEESRKISERVKWGMKRRMENGVVLGCGRIYGYKVIDGNLIIVPEEAEIVKQIFHRYLYDGKGSSAIARELCEQGVPTLKNRIWSSQHVLKILKNEKYVGDLTQWKVYKPNILSEKYLVNHGDNPDVPLITIKNHHEPIISRELWDGVQAERSRRGQLTKNGKKHSKSFWLSGKLVCGKCGYSFSVSSSSRNPYKNMRCRNAILYGKNQRVEFNGELVGCDNHTVDERVVEEAMKKVLGYIRERSGLLKEQMLKEIGMLKEFHKSVDVELLKEEIIRIETKKYKAIDLMLEGIITKDELKKQSQMYDDEIAKITEQIAQSQNASADNKQKMNEIAKAIDNISRLDENKNSDCKEFYRSMIKQIVVPEYKVLQIYLNGVPFGFKVTYTTKKAPRLGIYDIVFDECEIVFL